MWNLKECRDRNYAIKEAKDCYNGRKKKQTKARLDIIECTLLSDGT